MLFRGHTPSKPVPVTVASPGALLPVTEARVWIGTLIWFVPPPLALPSTPQALFRSMMTKLVAEDQIGKMQAALGAIEEVCNITGPLVFLKTYEGTVGSFPQAFLLVAAGLSGLSSVLVLLVNV